MSPYKNPEDKRENARRYWQANKERLKAARNEYNRKYYEENKERLRELAKENYYANREHKLAYQKEYEYNRRRNDPEHAQRCLERGKEYYYKNRAFLIDYLGGKCTACGTTENLEFDHKDPKEKSFSISGNLKQSINERMMKEIDKCHLLCSDCHKKKTFTLDKDTILEKRRETRSKNNEL
jgi:5-methylcytosine-specific restriction endonuclease McrA